MTWATMMKTSAASVQSSLLGFSVTSNLGKLAGPPPPHTHTQILFRVFVLLTRFFCLSPSQGPCCGQDCGFKPAGQTCDEETDCQRASVCSGLSPSCPEPSAKENLTVCSLGTRVCLNGVSIISHSLRRCTIKPGLQKSGLSLKTVKQDQIKTWDQRTF